MTALPQRLDENATPAVLLTVLPGPDRKRAASAYSYRLLHRRVEPEASGCLMIWEVTGGRLTYQIALEQADDGRLHLHCTCADFVFRAEPEGRFCKHLRGLLRLGRPDDEAIDRLEPRLAVGA